MKNERFSDFDECCPPRERGPGPSFVVGLVIVGVGVVLLLERFGVIDSDLVFQFWPLLISVFGLAKLLEARTGCARVFGVVLILAGVGLYLHNQDIFRLDWGTIWPIALISLGVSLLTRSLWFRKNRQAPEGPSASTLREWTVFGGGRRVITSQDFRGGELFAIFGGYEADLTRAAIKADEVELQVNAIFGGIEIHVPGSWQVINHGVPIFGGFEDKRLTGPGNGGEQTGRLIIRGHAVFGGVEIMSQGG